MASEGKQGIVIELKATNTPRQDLKLERGTIGRGRNARLRMTFADSRRNLLGTCRACREAESLTDLVWEVRVSVPERTDATTTPAKRTRDALSEA